MKTTFGSFGLRHLPVTMILLGSLVQAQDVAPFPPAPRDVSSITRIVSDDEPGERLVITGTIYKSDKKTPYEGLVLYFYQTDATGVYNKTNGSWQEPRLRGWVKTDANGRYEVRTVKPGSYPTRREAAHIHVTMKPPGGSPLWLDGFLFENDPYLGDRELREAAGAGSFSHILKVTRGKDKTLRCVRDFLITAED